MGLCAGHVDRSGVLVRESWGQILVDEKQTLFDYPNVQYVALALFNIDVGNRLGSSCPGIGASPLSAGRVRGAQNLHEPRVEKGNAPLPERRLVCS